MNVLQRYAITRDVKINFSRFLQLVCTKCEWLLRFTGDAISRVETRSFDHI